MLRFTPTSLRKAVLRMAYAGSTVHVGCAFSIIEICAVLYRNHLRYPGFDPRAQDRDYLVLSKGHGVMAQYACLHELGWIADDELDRYFGDGTRLKGLSDAHVPGCEVTSGSLGHGLSVGVGLAMAAKLRNTDQRCYVIAGDGEMNEGTMWEALLFARHQKLDNLTLIIDENGFQAMGRTDEVLGLGDLARKLESFGFESRTVDGHDEQALDDAVRALNASRNDRPKAIVARTVKGKGVSFMENENAWHYTRLSADTFAQAMVELEER
ncbi:transketolase [Trinickia fusca]|uniref:Transketolase n=1 Tax=Trinickia fusca TaxID=2419777 RepID=A0A494XJM0_9BURK|nr:transketolase [Trinickia fusca]RKP50860.1 transketolase [Trinickia fusca]